MTVSEIAPLIRIGSYVAATWLVARGMPQPIADIIGSDPAFHELLAQALGIIIGFGAFAWWRIAKAFGWTT